MRPPLPVALSIFASIGLFLGFSPADAAHPPRSEPAVRVGIVLFEGVQIIDFAAPYEVFGQAGFGVVTITHDGRAVSTAMGLKVTPDHGFADAPAFDVLLVPGGNVEDAQRDTALLDFIRRRAAVADHVLSICTGSHVLGAAGLLDGRQATTFHRALGDLAQRYPKIEVIRDVRWADSGKTVTSAGLSSGIDAALHVVAKLRGEDKARATALHLEYDWKPEGGFVRTLMADRHLPDLARLPWPQDMQAHPMISLGDQSAWRVRLRLATAASRTDVLRILDEGMDALQDWQRVDDANGHHWRKPVDRGHALLMFEAFASDEPGTFELETRLTVKQAKTP